MICMFFLFFVYVWLLALPVLFLYFISFHFLVNVYESVCVCVCCWNNEFRLWNRPSYLYITFQCRQVFNKKTEKIIPNFCFRFCYFNGLLFRSYFYFYFQRKREINKIQKEQQNVNERINRSPCDLHAVWLQSMMTF